MVRGEAQRAEQVDKDAWKHQMMTVFYMCPKFETFWKVGESSRSCNAQLYLDSAYFVPLHVSVA